MHPLWAHWCARCACGERVGARVVRAMGTVVGAWLPGAVVARLGPAPAYKAGGPRQSGCSRIHTVDRMLIHCQCTSALIERSSQVVLRPYRCLAVYTVIYPHSRPSGLVESLLVISWSSKKFVGKLAMSQPDNERDIELGLKSPVGTNEPPEPEVSLLIPCDS